MVEELKVSDIILSLCSSGKVIISSPGNMRGQRSDLPPPPSPSDPLNLPFFPREWGFIPRGEGAVIKGNPPVREGETRGKARLSRQARVLGGPGEEGEGWWPSVISARWTLKSKTARPPDQFWVWCVGGKNVISNFRICDSCNIGTVIIPSRKRRHTKGLGSTPINPKITEPRIMSDARFFSLGVPYAHPRR